MLSCRCRGFAKMIEGTVDGGTQTRMDTCGCWMLKNWEFWGTCPMATRAVAMEPRVTDMWSWRKREGEEWEGEGQVMSPTTVAVFGSKYASLWMGGWSCEAA